MKQNIKITRLSIIALIITLGFSISLFGGLIATQIEAKAAAPLSLGDVMTGLRSTKTSLKLRNSLLTTAVLQRGITFSLQSEIEKELRNAGAGNDLIGAIQQKSKPAPKTTPTVTPEPSPSPGADPRAVLDSFVVEHNVEVGGEIGMSIRPKFTIYDLKGVDTYFIIYFETASGKSLKTQNSAYATTSGNLIVYKAITPCCNAAVAQNTTLFLPYSEVNLPKGSYNLRMNVNLIYKNTGRITQFGFYNFNFSRG